MAYDLRKRIETFADGSFSSEAFIEELATHCADAPDFIWDVLALIDQYHRRGKISAEFQRSVRDLIERPALTHEQPPASSQRAAPPAGSAMALSRGTSGARVEPRAAHEPKPADTRPDSPHTGARNHSAQPAHAPMWATDGQIFVPVLREYSPPARDVQAPVLSHRMVLPAQTVSDPWPASLTELKIQVRLNRAADLGASMRVPGLHRTGRSRSLQIALLAVLVCCVTASSAIYKLAIKPLAAPAPVASPPLEPPRLSLSSDSYIVYPGAKSVLIEVNRTGDSSGEVSFVWWTRESGAKSGQDYRGSRPKTEHLAAGVDTLQWTIPIYANAARRHTEMFYVFIGSPGGGADVGATTRATIFVMSPE